MRYEVRLVRPKRIHVRSRFCVRALIDTHTDAVAKKGIQLLVLTDFIYDKARGSTYSSVPNHGGTFITGSVT